MRRLAALLVIALVGATLFGLSNSSSGVSVNHTTISNAEMRAELSAISTNLNLQCHIAALNPVNYAPGAGVTVAAAGAAEWTNLRVEGLAIVQYAKAHLQFRPTSASFAKARVALESELTQAALARNYQCPGTAAQAVDAMPSDMRTAQIEAEDASLYLISRLNSTIPLTTASLQAYFHSHLSSYQNICVSIALVPVTQEAAFYAAQHAGASIATLARKFSQDPQSAAKGGVYGCYDATSAAYSSVSADTANTPLNTFPNKPIQYNATQVLYVAPTSRTNMTFAKAESLVLSAVQKLNTNAAAAVTGRILYQSAIAVDPAYGRWALTSSGPSVFAPATPPGSSVGNAQTLKALATASKVAYK